MTRSIAKASATSEPPANPWKTNYVLEERSFHKLIESESIPESVKFASGKAGVLVAGELIQWQQQLVSQGFNSVCGACRDKK